MTAKTETPVLIVGGSLVGLATSMFLGMHGVPCLSVERHRGTAIHPRAGYFQLRTLELMRIAGIEDKVVAAAHALYDPNGGLNAVETLAGREIANYIPDINQGVEDLSPARRLFMPQQVLEPILKDRAVELGSRFRYATELVDFTQDDEGVTALVRDVDTRAEETIRARYMVACDGNRSPVREKLGIAMVGTPVLSHSVTIYFRADCSRALRGRNLGVIYVNNPQVRGFFRLEKTGLGGFLVVFTVGDINEPGSRKAAEGITVDRAVQYVREAVGEPDLAVQVEDIASWFAFCRTAESFQKGRIFIAGDAAHTVTPTGGYGGNTGVQDAHNLAWKLACVLRGEAGEGLLDTYDQERRPAGRQAVEQAYNRYVTRSDPDLGMEGVKPPIPDTHVEYNLYRSEAVIPDPDIEDDGRIDIDPRQSFARPGTRAPHVAMRREGRMISTLDLYGHGFVLVAGHEGGAWTEAARAAAAATGVEVAAHVVAAAGFAEAYGIEPSGAVLVRPDGYVAWREKRLPADPAARLADALERVLFRKRGAAASSAAA